MVSKCTLHNIDFIEKTKVKIGDIVQITRSGDVIPKFIKVVETSEDSIDIEYPETCPCCGDVLIQDGPFLYCQNEECEDKLRYQVMHFIKRCGVEYASFKTLKNLNISTIQDLLTFKANKKYKSELKLEKEINDKIFTLSEKDIFVKLNMKDIGEILLSKIVDFYGWDKIVTGEIESCSLAGLPEGIGEITFNKFIANYRKNRLLTNMIVSDSRYHFIEEEEKTKQIDIVGSVCFTGSLNTMTRTQASKLAESRGYQIKNSVTKGLTYLVTNDKFSGSSKNKKAQSLGTKIIDENEFLTLMSNNLMSVDDL
jgi:DNA ligase (NAD+)